MTRAGSHRARKASAVEDDLINRVDESVQFGRTCTPCELLARFVTEHGAQSVNNALDAESMAYYQGQSVPLDDAVALHKWARKVWAKYLRESAELNFLTKIAQTSMRISVRNPFFKGLAEFVVAKPKSQTEVSGPDGGAIPVANLSAEDLSDDQLAAILRNEQDD